MSEKIIKLSIILPCYNVEKYITECLDSLYVQDIQEAEYELICVNDCSPDATRDIIIEYQKTHDNLVLIDHKVNKKQGGARNTGLQAAKGEYIWFVDPDDYIESNILRTLLSEIKTNDLDILFFNYEKFELKQKLIETPKVEFPIGVHTGNVIFVESNFWDVTSLSWLRICRKKILVENKIYFYSDFFMEDVTYGIRCFLAAQRVKHVPLKCYYYRTTPNSVMNSGMGGLKTASYLKLAIEYYKLSKEVVEQELSIKFIEIARFYIQSIVKPILYLDFRERVIFNNSIMNIIEIEDYKKLSPPFLLVLEIENVLFKRLLFVLFPILNMMKKIKNGFKI